MRLLHGVGFAVNPEGAQSVNPGSEINSCPVSVYIHASSDGFFGSGENARVVAHLPVSFRMLGNIQHAAHEQNYDAAKRRVRAQSEPEITRAVSNEDHASSIGGFGVVSRFEVTPREGAEPDFRYRSKRTALCS